MQNKPLNASVPVVLLTTITTLLAGAAAGSGGVGYTATADYLLIRHIRFTNTSASAVTFQCWIGTTSTSAYSEALATIGVGVSIAANSAYDWYGYMRLDGGVNWLFGLAGTTAVVNVQAEGEIGHI